MGLKKCGHHIRPFAIMIPLILVSNEEQRFLVAKQARKINRGVGRLMLELGDCSSRSFCLFDSELTDDLRSSCEFCLFSFS